MDEENEFQKQHLMMLKDKIENGQVFSPRLFVNLTFTGHKIIKSDGKTIRQLVREPTEDEATAKFISWGMYNAQKHKAHILPWGVIETSKEHRIHIHTILASDEELPTSIVEFWKQNYGMRSYADQYDPSRRGVRYIYDHHDAMKLGFQSVFCPRHRGSCRRSRCIYRKRGTDTRVLREWLGE